MTQGKIIAIVIVSIILLVAIFFIARNLTTKSETVVNPSTSVSTGGIGDVILSWLTGFGK